MLRIAKVETWNRKKRVILKQKTLEWRNDAKRRLKQIVDRDSDDCRWSLEGNDE